MNAKIEFPEIALRIPGDWAHPGKLLERMPDGFRLTQDSLTMPDGTKFEFVPMPPDGQFPRIFASSCRRPPTREERSIVSRYTVNVGLSGPGGSLAAAHRMMEAGAAIIRAGGAGVFIDNCAMAHGGRDWIEMTEIADSDAISFAFAALIAGKGELYTAGLQALGLPNLRIRQSEVDQLGGDAFIEVIRELCREGRPVSVGHQFEQPFRAVERFQDDFDDESPMHNPLGSIRIASLTSLASEN